MSTEAKGSYEGAGDSHTFVRQLTWKDGFAIALVVPVALFATVPSAAAAVGTWGVIAILAVTCVVALLQNKIYSELAGMFPDKAGGIPLYAHEAWRKYFAPLSGAAAFGYWAGWAFANAVFALTLGGLVQAQFFSSSTWTIDLGGSDVGLGHFIGVAALVSIWVLNAIGIRPTVQINKVLGLVACLMIGILAIGPFLTGDFSSDGLTWGLGLDGQAWGGWRLALVFLFLLGWTTYSTEICATFTPEYEDPKRDMNKALRVSGVFTLAVAVLFPLGIGGTLGDKAIAADPGGIYAAAFDQIVGPAAGLVTIVIALSLYLVMNSCTARVVLMTFPNPVSQSATTGIETDWQMRRRLSTASVRVIRPASGRPRIVAAACEPEWKNNRKPAASANWA